MESRKGLEWEEGIFGFHPQWTCEPSMDTIKDLACRHLDLSADESAQSTISFQFQGGFNKLYAFDCSRGSYLMRVSLPVDPRYKTLSEAATIKYVSSKASIPVPKIMAYDSSNDNDLQFEWILMERVVAKNLMHSMPSMDWAPKIALVKAIANVMAQLFRLRFQRIGSLFSSQDLQPPSTSDKVPSTVGGVVGGSVHRVRRLFRFAFPRAGSMIGGLFNTVRQLFQFAFSRVGRLATSQHPPEVQAASEGVSAGGVIVDRIVSMTFFWHKHYNMDIPRGPFLSSRDWILARLTLEENDINEILEDETTDPDYIEDAQRSKLIIARLRKHLPSYFPSDGAETEHFALHHGDISRQNILVDDSGRFKALVDWECVSVMPLWKVCQIPSFLTGPECPEKPNPHDYGNEADVTENSVYVEDVDKHERTLLRRVFLDEMRVVEPEWVLEHERSMEKADFDLAVENCNRELGMREVERWLDRLDTGKEYQSLHASYYES